MKTLILTDLDGTLLDHETYSWAAARPALKLSKSRDAAVVLCSSKTRAEMDALRAALGLSDPFITENGAGLFVPRGYFPDAPEGSEERDGLYRLALGAEYAELVQALARASRSSGVAVKGFSGMTAEEVAGRTGLELETARLAARREFVEPFAVEGGAEPEPLLQAIEALGYQWTRGGRFFHILGGSSKARAARTLIDHYRRYGPVRTMGLGDAENDAGFLREVDHPVVVRGKRSDRLSALLPGARQTERPGPEGWNAAVLEFLG